MTSTQPLPHTVSEKLKKKKKNRRLSTTGLQPVFCQHHILRNSYHTRTDWLQYRINLVIIVTVDFQQKIDLSLNDWLDSQIVFGFSDRTWYAKW